MNSSPANHSSTASCEFQENLDILRQIYFFSGLPLEALKVMAYLGTREKFKPDDAIFNQGEDDGQAYFLISGHAQLVREDNGGEILIRDVDQEAFLGGLALVSPIRRLFTLKAVTEVECLIIKREKFTSAMQRFPEILTKIFKAVIENIELWEERFITSLEPTDLASMHRLGVSLL